MINTKGIDLTDTTIKLVASVDNKRASLFESLINSRTLYSLVGNINDKLSEDAYFHIFFNFDTFKDRKENLLTEMAKLQEDCGLTILDISDSSYLTDENSSIANVAALFASYLTCSSSELQEQIFEYTGRLATIVEHPLFNEDFTKPFIEKKKKKDVKVIWYGLHSEVFSIKPYTQVTDFNIEAYFEYKDNRNWKQWGKKIEDSDIVFLPKTFTQEDEEIRSLKVEECVKLGKFVVAPALEGCDICMDCELHEAVSLFVNNPNKIEKIVKENQNNLKRIYSPEVSADQLMQALKLAPDDEFSSNLTFSVAKDIIERKN